MINSRIIVNSQLIQSFENITRKEKISVNEEIGLDKKEKIKKMIENNEYKINIENTAKAMAKKLIL